MGWIHDFTQAVVIMMLGMGVTFSFLVALIFVIQVSARIIAKYAFEPEPVPPPRAAIPGVQAKDASDVIAAITIAVKKYHADKKGKNF